jgi:prepilin-type N-terminal cleavage/methylation domain-containing protein
MTTRRRNITCAGAFTLIEVLVVIAIIAILMALVIGGGSAVIGGRKVSVTQNVLLGLDRALEEYIASNNNQIPPFRPEAYASVPGRDVYSGDNNNHVGGTDPQESDLPVGPDKAFTRYNDRTYPRYPDAAVFVEQAQGYGEVDAILAGLGDRWLVPTPAAGSDTLDRERSVAPSIVDAWNDGSWQSEHSGGNGWPVLEGNLIFYVHPSNLLAQGLYGQCLNNRPYFFSAGPSGLYGVTNQFNSGVPRQNWSQRDSSDATVQQAIDALGDNIYSYSVGPANVSDPASGSSFSKQHR